MYCSIAAFLADWDEESKSMLKYFDVLTDDALNQKVWEEGRVLGRIAWHIVQTVPEMLKMCGFPNIEFDDNAPVPQTSKEIRDRYAELSGLLSKSISESWTDEMLGEEVEMYGQKWKRGKVLQSIITHQTHHRGQLSVLMRQAGLKVPGVYGPSKEEWVQYGMETAE